MGPGNETQISEFLLLGFTEVPEVQPLLFGLFLSMYLVTIFGNLVIILAIIIDCHLHTPMYFFLSILSLCDIGLSSTTVPKMLVNIQAQSRVITYAGCLTQMYFFLLFGGLDDCLLAVMAYDRFVAICHPLHYTVSMKPQICVLMALGSWTMSVMESCLQSLLVSQLSFCSSVEIPNFFCELRQMVQLACSDTFLNYLVMYLIAGVLAGGPLAGILFSYYKIVSSVFAISSAQGKYKAFSTCASHLSVVSLFYFTTIGVYLSPAASNNTHSGAPATVMYTMVTPMLNPFIYSLRNKDIKKTLKKCFGRKVCKVSFVLQQLKGQF
ncbi:olfactory receptor 7A17-like [Dasypus novemcinctus]|uniref:olfactory receptor 7A17-like n=1 Tax=Dasypus novemcinctus TaxID=9361 RepID=UPI0039C91048